MRHHGPRPRTAHRGPQATNIRRKPVYWWQQTWRHRTKWPRRIEHTLQGAEPRAFPTNCGSCNASTQDSGCMSIHRLRHMQGIVLAIEAEASDVRYLCGVRLRWERCRDLKQSSMTAALLLNFPPLNFEISAPNLRGRNTKLFGSALQDAMFACFALICTTYLQIPQLRL